MTIADLIDRLRRLDPAMRVGVLEEAGQVPGGVGVAIASPVGTLLTVSGRLDAGRDNEVTVSDEEVLVLHAPDELSHDLMAILG